MERTERFKKLLDIATEDRPSTKEVVDLLSKFIVEIRKYISITTDEIESRFDTKGNKISVEISTRLDKAIDSLESKIIDIAKSASSKNEISTKDWYKALNNAIYDIERQINDIKEYDDTAIQTKWSTVIDEIYQKIDNIKPFITQPTDIRDALEMLEGDERLDISAIKGFEKLVSDIKSSGKNVRLVGGTNGIMVYNGTTKLGIVKYVNFTGSGVTSSLVNGLLTLTFSASSTNIAMQQVTAVASGSNITIDLTQLSHTFKSIVMVTNQGQVLDTVRWSVLSTVMTVTNVFDSDSYQIQYTY